MTFLLPRDGLMAVGERVKARRCELGMTQVELAQRAGVSRTVVTNVEAARQGLSQQSLSGFATALGMSYAELMPEGSAMAADNEPASVVEPDDRRRRSGPYLMAVVRCHACGSPIERDGSYAKDGWRYWCVACFRALAHASVEPIAEGVSDGKAQPPG